MRKKRVRSGAAGRLYRLIRLLARIRDFLSKFKQEEKDLAQNFANIDIEDQTNGIPAEIRSLKYMSQLVRVYHRLNA
jgi:hypothetical protein